MIEDQLFSITGKTLKDFNSTSPIRSNRTLLLGNYHRVTHYNLEKLLNSISEDEPKLTDEQRNVYNNILESVNEKQGKLFWNSCHSINWWKNRSFFILITIEFKY